MLPLEQYRTLVEAAPNLVWRAGVDGKCDYFNETWLAFTGRSLEQEIGDGWAEGVHPDDLERCVGHYRTCLEQRRAFEMEYRLRRHDGAFRWILDRGSPFHDEHGRFAGFIGSCVDVHERRTAEEAKATFLSLLAHELRTPVQALLASAREIERAAAEQRALPAGVARHFLRQIERLRSLADHADNGAAAGLGRSPDIEPETVDAARLVQEAIRIQMESGRARRRGAPALRLHHDGQAASVHADPGRMIQVLDIVLDNALKFTPQGGAVDITLDSTPDEVTITVDDEGIGIPHGDLPRVGTPYFRGANAPAMQYSGLGLGLMIAVDVVRAHGGRLQLSARSPRGTRVLVALPRKMES